MAVTIVQMRDLGFFQQADQAPSALEVAEQTLAGMNASPAQAGPRVVAAARPVEALPDFALVVGATFECRTKTLPPHPAAATATATATATAAEIRPAKASTSAAQPVAQELGFDPI